MSNCIAVPLVMKCLLSAQCTSLCWLARHPMKNQYFLSCVKRGLVNSDPKFFERNISYVRLEKFFESCSRWIRVLLFNIIPWWVQPNVIVIKTRLPMQS